MLRRAEWTAAVLLTLALAGLHLLRVGHAGALWRDEAAAAALATLPTWGEVAANFQHEAFPLLFPAVVRGWTAAFGAGDLALRAFGAVIGLALLAALWHNARSLGGTVPLISLVLAAANPRLLVFGDSLRGYGLGTVLILLTFGAFGRLAVRPGGSRTSLPRAALPAALLAVASVQCLLHNAVLLLALGVAAALVAARRRRWGAAGLVLGCGAISALSLLPYAGQLADARSWSILVTFPIGPREVLDILARTLAAPLPAFLGLWCSLLALGLLIGIWRAGTWRLRDRRAPAGAAEGVVEGPEATADVDAAGVRADLRLYALLALPLALAAQVAFLSLLRYAPRPWYFLPLVALAASVLDLLLAVAEGGEGGEGPAARRHVRALRAARLAGAVLVAAVSAVPLWHLARVRMTDMDLVAQRVAERARPGDLVVVNPWYNGVSFRRYYRGPAPWETVPPLADHRFHRYDLFKERMQQADPLADLRAALAHTLRSGGTVWLVGGADFPPPGQPPHVLPPAPQAPTGWLDVPYRQSWSEQVGAYLRDHTHGGERIAVPAPGPVSGYEDVELIAVRGWRGAERGGP